MGRHRPDAQFGDPAIAGLETTLTLIGGPTILIELAGLRLLIDPTFDAPARYDAGGITLVKSRGPARAAKAFDPVDAVLLSHDQHFDNLDRAGRALLRRAGRVFTTPSAAARLGGAALGLALWEQGALDGHHGRRLLVTVTLALN